MRGSPVALAFVLLVSSVAAPVGAHDETPNDAPLADAGLDREVERGATVWLDGGGSLDPDGEIVAYEWSIETPGGATITPEDADAVSTTFAASETGRYEVTLTVTDDHGATRSDTLYVVVGPSAGAGEGPADGTGNDSAPNDPPTGAIDGPDTVARGEAATFTADVYDPDGEVTAFAWSDGRTGREVTKTIDAGVGETFSFSVRVTDDDGATATFRKSVRVVAADGRDGADPTNAPPNVWIDGPDRVAVGETASFVLRGSDPDGTVASNEWTAPTGASGVVLRHTFESAGNYSVSGTVTDDDGATASASKTVEVYDEGPPVVRISGPDIARTGTTQQYTLEAYDPDGGELTIHWSPSQNQLERSADPFANHVPIRGGVSDVVTVSATVTDDEGNTVTVVKETDVLASTNVSEGDLVPSVGDVSYEYYTDEPNETGPGDIVEIGSYNFSTPIFYSEGKYVRVTWTFNDTPRVVVTDPLGRFTGSKQSLASHTFTSDRGGLVTRAVTVTATDADGNTSQQQWVSRVRSTDRHDDMKFYAIDPATSKPKQTVSIAPGTELRFYVSSLSDYTVETGDGSTFEMVGGIGKSGFTYTYEEPGTYTVSVISSQGDDAKAVKQVVVQVAPETYYEYQYEVEDKTIEQVTSEERPDGPSWYKARISDSGRNFTGETVTVREGATRPSMLDEGWLLNSTETITMNKTTTRVARADPDGAGDEWWLIDRRVRKEDRTVVKDRFEWRSSRFNTDGWRFTGETRTEKEVYGHDHDRTRHEETTKSCVSWRVHRTVYGRLGRECSNWNYETRVWYTGHDHDKRVVYDTEYLYHTEVVRVESVWFNEYATKESRTVTIKTFAETEEWIEWLWQRDRVDPVTEYSLTPPQNGSYIDGTLRRVEVRCNSPESHFDQVMC